MIEAVYKQFPAGANPSKIAFLKAAVKYTDLSSVYAARSPFFFFFFALRLESYLLQELLLTRSKNRWYESAKNKRASEIHDMLAMSFAEEKEYGSAQKHFVRVRVCLLVATPLLCGVTLRDPRPWSIVHRLRCASGRSAGRVLEDVDGMVAGGPPRVNSPLPSPLCITCCHFCTSIDYITALICCVHRFCAFAAVSANNAQGIPQERDLFLARAVLLCLCVKNLKLANGPPLAPSAPDCSSFLHHHLLHHLRGLLCNGYLRGVCVCVHVRMLTFYCSCLRDVHSRRTGKRTHADTSH